MASRSRSWLGYGKFVSSWSRLAYLKCCGFVVRILAGTPQVCPGRGWDISSFVASWSVSRLGYLKFVASWSGSRLGYLKFVAWRSRSRLGYAKFCGFAVKIPVGIPQVCGVVVRVPVGIPQVLRARGEDPGWDTPSFVASRSGSRLLEIPQVCGFAVRIPVGIPQVLRLRGQDPGWGTSTSLWLRGQDPGWDTSGFVASWSVSRLGYLKFC